MIVWRSILFVAFLACGAFCLCNRGFIKPDTKDFYCDNLNDVLQIQNKSSVKSLTVSYVSGVTICDFPLLDGFENLLFLTLEEGLLKKVSKECFKGVPKLYFMKVTDQDIDEFDLDISSIQNLKDLHLYGNGLKTFYLGNKTFPKLHSLSLWRNNLSKFAFESSQAPNLWIIGLTENKIEEFDIVGDNLKSLDLENNRIKTFEGSRLIAPELWYLYLSFNNLMQITTNMIKDFPELTHASFNENPISLIDFSHMNISLLNCWGERIIIDKYSHLSRPSHQLPRLLKLRILVSWDSVRKVNFSNNQISNLNIFNTEFELKIEELIMRDNLISEVGQKDLAMLGDLIMIDLSNNIISSIDENAFQNSPKLHNILLRGNKLKTIQNSFLNNFKSIVSIDLRQNEINMFPLPGWDESTQENPLKSFDKIFLEEVLLQGNPLSCSNKNLLREWMSLHNQFVFHIEVAGRIDYLGGPDLAITGLDQGFPKLCLRDIFEKLNKLNLTLQINNTHIQKLDISQEKSH